MSGCSSSRVRDDTTNNIQIKYGSGMVLDASMVSESALESE